MELERKVDAVPSRAELAQYQRRFVELNEQVSTFNLSIYKFLLNEQVSRKRINLLRLKFAMHI